MTTRKDEEGGGGSGGTLGTVSGPRATAAPSAGGSGGTLGTAPAEEVNAGSEGAPNLSATEAAAAPALLGKERDAAAEQIGTGNAPVAPTWSALAAQWDKHETPQQVVTTPGGWVPGTHTQESSVKGWQPSQRTLQDYEAADRLQAQGLQGQSDVEAGASVAKQGVLSKIEQGTQEYVAGAAKRQQMQEKIKANRVAQIQQMGKDIDDFKFDRRRLFHSMDAGGVAAFAAGSLFGALGEGFLAAAGHPGQNAFMTNLNRSISRDIELQQQELAKKERGEGRARNALDALAQQMGDFNSARDALYIGQLKVYENELQRLSEQWKNTARGPQYQLALAQVMRERAAREQGFDAAQTATVAQQETEHHKPPSAVVVGGAGKPPTEDQIIEGNQKILSDADKKKLDEDERIVELGATGLKGNARTSYYDALRSGDFNRAAAVVLSVTDTDPAAAQARNEAITRWGHREFGGSLTDSEIADRTGITGGGSINPKRFAAFVGQRAKDVQKTQASLYATHRGKFARWMRDRERAQGSVPMLLPPNAEEAK